MTVSIGQKLTLSFLLVALLVGALGLVGYFHMRETRKQVHVIEEESGGLVILTGMKSQILEGVEGAFAYPLLNDPLAKLEFFDKLEQFDTSVAEFRGIARMGQSGQEEETELFEEIVASRAAMAVSARNMFASYERNRVINLLDVAAFEADIDKIIPLIDQFVEIEIEEVAEAQQDIQAAIAGAERLTIILITDAIVLAIGLGFLVSRSISIPINKLKKVAEELGKGNLGIRANINSRDEIGSLANSFDQMAEALQTGEKELETQRRELALSNRELEGHYMITRIFAESGHFHTKATAALERLVDLSSADWATLRLPDETEPGLHLAAAAGPSVAEFPPLPVLTQDQVLTTAAYTEGRIIVIDDYASSPAASQFLVDMGMQSMVILPVKVGERTLGLVTVISKGKTYFTPDLVDLLTSVVEGLGVLVENSILHDQTEKAHQELRQSAEALSRSNQELEQFANIASHDLQEPLRMVSSYTQLLASRYKDKLDFEAQEFIGYAVDGAKRMQTQIKELLAYSRLTTQITPFEPTDCLEVFDQATGNLSVSIEEHGAIVTSDPLPTVNGDKSQLVSVFQNLIGNGIKYQKDQQPKIHVSAVESGGEWLFSFRDNGIGIEPQYAERIFVIFQRLHSMTEYSGTGIGLAICKKVIERHGGRIWVQSKPQKGSTFYLTLPRAISLDNNHKGVKELERRTH